MVESQRARVVALLAADAMGIGRDKEKGDRGSDAGDGDLYFEQKTITPLKNEEGVITHFVSTGKDITARKQMEEEMEKVHLEKERLEAIRTLSMTYAHTILYALTPVKSYAEMIVKKTDPSDPRYRWARSILEGASHVVEIVGKLKEIDSYSTTEIGGRKILDLERRKGKAGGDEKGFGANGQGAFSWEDRK